MPWDTKEVQGKSPAREKLLSSLRKQGKHRLMKQIYCPTVSRHGGAKAEPTELPAMGAQFLLLLSHIAASSHVRLLSTPNVGPRASRAASLVNAGRHGVNP